MDAAAAWTNSNYGALDIAVSRVLFVHGSVDPWHALGITKTQDNDAPAIYIKGIFYLCVLTIICNSYLFTAEFST